MKKEDIILRKGDKVYYIDFVGKNSSMTIYLYDGLTIKEFEEDGSKITKIDRLETIYEAPDAPKEILDKEEKEYLEAVLRPYRHQVVEIFKKEAGLDQEYIKIDYNNEKVYASFQLPYFDKNTMYKGMELGKHYTLAELGLFEGE